MSGFTEDTIGHSPHLPATIYCLLLDLSAPLAFCGDN